MAKKFIRIFFCGGDILICLSLFSLIMLMTFAKDILLALKNNSMDAAKQKSLRVEKSMAYELYLLLLCLCILISITVSKKKKKTYELCIFLSFKHCEAQGYGDPIVS